MDTSDHDNSNMDVSGDYQDPKRKGDKEAEQKKNRAQTVDSD